MSDYLLTKDENSPDEQNDSYTKVITDQSGLIGGVFLLPGQSEILPSPIEEFKTDNKEVIVNRESNWNVSISPDGENVLAYNHEQFEFKIIHKDDLDSADKVKNASHYKIKNLFEESDQNTKWMVAISDVITKNENNRNEEVLVVISRVTRLDMTVKKSTSKISFATFNQPENQTNEMNNDVSFYDDKDSQSDDVSVQIDDVSKGKTIIFKVTLGSSSDPIKLHTEETGGIVTFVHGEIKEIKEENMPKKTYCFIFNANGILRYTFCDLGFKGKEFFDYPKRLQSELETLYKNKSCITRLYNSIFDHYFFIEQYKEGTQILQLYDLNTMKIEQIFSLREEKYEKSVKRFGDPVFARSRNERIIAFSTGFRKISLFHKGNGLEIASQDFGSFLKFEKDVKIVCCDFINNDETLIVIVQKPGHRSVCKVLFWNLFNTKDTIIEGKDVNFEMNEENLSSAVRIPGKFITIKPDGSIFSVFDKLVNDIEIKGKGIKGIELYSIVISKTDKGTSIKQPNQMSKSIAKSKKDDDEKHKIYHRKGPDRDRIRPIVKNKEPWLTDDFDRTSVYLDEDENVQLFIGRSTVQVWRKISDKKLNLEYIWTNNVGIHREENEGLEILELYVGHLSFYLKVKTLGLKPFEIRWPYKDNHVTPIKHACDAMEHLHYRRNKLVGYKKQHEFEHMKDRITYLIWRFIKNKPNTWRLMDARYDVMAKIIIGGSNILVKYILFGDEKNKNNKNWNLHVPILHEDRWDSYREGRHRRIHIEGEEERINVRKLSDLQIAIRLCKGGLEGNRRTLIVTYLLEYYTQHSLNQVGWLATVSEALPDLYEHKLDHYAKELFYKRCMSGLEMSNIIEYTDFTPKEVQLEFKASQQFIAFSPISKLILHGSNESSKFSMAELYLKIFPDNKNVSPTVKALPLQNFTVCKIPQKQKHVQIGSTLAKIFKWVFIPRGYLKDKQNDESSSDLSPLVQIIRAETDDDDIFDNPAMEAAINYKWGPARNYFLRMFFYYILYAACFAALGGCYVSHADVTGFRRNFLVFLFILFYYLGCYLFLVECRQFQHHNWRHYLEFFNFIDLSSIVISLTIMSVYIIPSFKLTNGFADVETTKNLTAAISFTMLLLWFEFILYLRLLSEPAKYLYIILNIVQRTFLFVGFMLLVVLALSHAFLFLLQYPQFTNVTPSVSSFTMTDPNGNLVGSITQDFDPTSDNPGGYFGKSFLATYAWLRGSYQQSDTYEFWAVQALTLIASLFLITVVQNIFIAFIWGVYAEAYEKGRVALLRFRAELISDYEALDEIYFTTPPSEPKYIYYVGRADGYFAWKKTVQEREKDGVTLYKDIEDKMNETDLSYEEKEDEDPFWKYNESDVNNENNDKNNNNNNNHNNPNDNNNSEDVNTQINSLKSKVDEILSLLKK